MFTKIVVDTNSLQVEYCVSLLCDKVEQKHWYVPPHCPGRGYVTSDILICADIGGICKINCVQQYN
jgi:hypothetical protein